MDPQPPRTLYYVTVHFSEDEFESPRFFVFDQVVEAVATIRRYYSFEHRHPKYAEFKEMKFLESRLLPEEAFVLLPTSDFNLGDEDLNTYAHEEEVRKGENYGKEDCIVGVFPDEQDDDELLCRAYYMGPMRGEPNVNEMMLSLKRDPIETPLVPDVMWFYKPTGETREVKLG